MFKFKNLALLFAICAFSISQAWATMVTFQVDMTVQEALSNFNPAEDLVVVRGSFNGWGGNTNQATDNGSGVYVVAVDIPAGLVQYKFVMVQSGGDVWETVVIDPDDGGNRYYTVGGDPATLPVVFFSDLGSAENTDVEVNFRVDMTVQALSGNFNPESDWVVVRGNHTNIGGWGGAVRLLEETGNPGIYSLWIQFTDQSTVAPIEYKFVILTGGDPDDPTPGWEPLANNRTVLCTGDEPDNLPPPNGNGYGEIMPPLVFWGDITADDIITQDVAVTFQVEIRPLVERLAEVGYVYDVQTGDTVFSIESLQVAGENDPLGWDWGNIPAEFNLNDAGTGGDVTAGDGVWSVTVNFPAGTARDVTYKYGCNGLDAEAGFARNHVRGIDDTNPTYMFAIDCWGSPDTLFQNWECLISGVDDGRTPVINDFSLEQNFPNPFNPSTTIAFNLTQSNFTTLNVFNVLGRTVGTIDMGRMNAGRHTISFDASSLSSGVYFYKLESGAFNATRKMLLLK